ncbi:hypothetical protein BNJ_00163 [Kaumoebavirus]|uniref:hypothetical protein n=1 Tax=Kaumoebavirus TaxID=1859492 RepID=UPI0009C39EAC|nr:hypothetical protein BNJ_00163 [Kaumoebavirus]ARA71995.1 hypothetical protein BNJ_00163 [Kaumoebavirus]
MEVPREIVLKLVKLAGHTAWESSVRVCKYWREWIKADAKLDRKRAKKEWEHIFEGAMQWSERLGWRTLPNDTYHGKVYVATQFAQVYFEAYRGLLHGNYKARISTPMGQKEITMIYEYGVLKDKRDTTPMFIIRPYSYYL